MTDVQKPRLSWKDLKYNEEIVVDGELWRVQKISPAIVPDAGHWYGNEWVYHYDLTKPAQVRISRTVRGRPGFPDEYETDVIMVRA